VNKRLKICAYALAFLSCASLAQASVATGFVFPVGNSFFPPTESASNMNGYHIAQGFNTSSDPGSPNGGWCADQNLNELTQYTSQSACQSASTTYKWMFGHTGVDLSNGACGGPISATADGVVEFSGAYAGYGNLLKIRHVLPNGKVVHSLYGHRQYPVMMTAGQVVTMGQIVGYVGNTGAGTCHLHFEIYADELQSIIGIGASIVPVGYLWDDSGNNKTSSGTPIHGNIFHYFFDPLLFVDDRNNNATYATSLQCCGISAMPAMSFSALSKTMYATDATGTTQSLQYAVNAGWMDKYIYEKGTDGNWYYYPSLQIDQYVLMPNKIYGFIAKKAGVTVRMFRPGNNYLDARARQDMMAYVQTVSSFSYAFRWSFGKNVNWSPPDAITWMGFLWSGNQWVYVDQAYDTTNPLIRWISYYNPNINSWTSWVQVY
jgi:murein DD-endopeptidase MepM/ murein hydrolase activator NlpD